jgi:RNA polymerase sigma factor (sigma-70 family)
MIMIENWARVDLWNRGRETIQDAVADTCSEVALHLGKARSGDTFRGFVLGHYLNARKRALRARLVSLEEVLDRLDVSLEEVEDRAGHGPNPHLEADPYELALLQRCLAELSARERRSVELRYLEGASSAAMAEELDVTITNARQILFTARNRLRECARRAWPQGRE